MKQRTKPFTTEPQQDDQPEGHQELPGLSPIPAGVRSTVVDVIGPYLQRKHEELFRRLAEYDRDGGPTT